MLLRTNVSALECSACQDQEDVKIITTSPKEKNNPLSLNWHTKTPGDLHGRKEAFFGELTSNPCDDITTQMERLTFQDILKAIDSLFFSPSALSFSI